jgi:hypothetical protein
MTGPTWVDRFIARPYRVNATIVPDESNPWYRKWAHAKRQPRDRWPWRIRLEVWWFRREYRIGLLYFDVTKYRKVDVREPGFGVHLYIDSKGWIEGLAT